MSPAQFRKLCRLLAPRLQQEPPRGRGGAVALSIEEKVAVCLEWLSQGTTAAMQQEAYGRGAGTLQQARYEVVGAIVQFLYPAYVTQDAEKDYLAPARAKLEMPEYDGLRMNQQFEGALMRPNDLRS